VGRAWSPRAVAATATSGVSVAVTPDIAAGDPSLRHITVADPDTAEEVLLNLARNGTANHLETVVRAVRRRRTPPSDLAARRSLSWQWDQDGSLILRARLTPDDGAALIAAIEALIPPGTPNAHPVPPSPEDLEQRAREQEPGPAADRLAARRVDALLSLVNGHTHTDTGSGSGRLRWWSGGMGR
jgi:hypothetical protein